MSSSSSPFSSYEELFEEDHSIHLSVGNAFVRDFVQWIAARVVDGDLASWTTLGTAGDARDVLELLYPMPEVDGLLDDERYTVLNEWDYRLRFVRTHIDQDDRTLRGLVRTVVSVYCATLQVPVGVVGEWVSPPFTIDCLDPGLEVRVLVEALNVPLLERRQCILAGVFYPEADGEFVEADEIDQFGDTGPTLRLYCVNE